MKLSRHTHAHSHVWHYRSVCELELVFLGAFQQKAHSNNKIVIEILLNRRAIFGQIDQGNHKHKKRRKNEKLEKKS